MLNASNYNNNEITLNSQFSANSVWLEKVPPFTSNYKINVELFLTKPQMFLSWLRAFKYAASLCSWNLIDQSYLLAQLCYMQHQLELFEQQLILELFGNETIDSANVKEILIQTKTCSNYAVVGIERRNIKELAVALHNWMHSLNGLLLVLQIFMHKQNSLDQN